MVLKEGDDVPYFEAEDTFGNKVKLTDFKGKKLVLYFYPKDDTPGCTKEACDFRDNIGKFKKLNAFLVGVSNDNSESHKKFSEKYNLPFTLLCDTDKKISNDYGVYGEKNFMGNTYIGIRRTTFIIDEKGAIKKIFNDVKVDGHIDEVLEILKC